MRAPDKDEANIYARTNRTDGPLFPWYTVGIAAIVCAIALIALAALGPLGTGSIQYRTSPSGEWQTEGQDLTDVVLIVPLLLIGGALQLMRRESAKYFLVLTPITLMYTGFSVGIGQEWSEPAYSGNVESFFWIFLVLIIGGLFLLIGTLPLFSPRDAPEFDRRGLRIFAGLTALALMMFGLMWMGQIFQITGAGDLPDGSYAAAPTVFWTIRYLDLGISIPLGFMALYLLVSKPQRAYPLVLLFFGFFITTGTAVNVMALVMVLNNDPGVAMLGPSIAIFPALGALSFIGLGYLLRGTLRRRRGTRAAAAS